ncbi:MAG: DUF3467 domain-containing protein [Magnetococcales bacterium]|nr:DUF3467 domain-containing protein [Magnetococcales bacterium]
MKRSNTVAETRAKQAKQPPQADAEATQAAGGTKVVWNDEKMVSTYANVSNVATTRDEVMFLFGTSEMWNNVQDQVSVQLSNRIIMTPSAAKRFHALLTRTLEDYEKNFGS